MKEIRYSIVFDGQILAGIPEKTVKSSLATVCVEEGLRPDDLFSGDTFTLRRDLSREEADRFVHDLLLAGAVVRKVRYTEEEKPVLQFPELISTEEPAQGGPAANGLPEPWETTSIGQERPHSRVQSLLQADTLLRGVEREILEEPDSMPPALEIVEEEKPVFDEAAATAGNWDSPNDFWKNSSPIIPTWGESERE